MSRVAIQSVFEKSAIGFRFEGATPVDGQPRIMGTAPNGLATVELIGQPNNLVSATIMVGLPNDDANIRMENATYTAGFMKVAAPQWAEGVDWLSQELTSMANGGSDEASTTFGSNQVSMTIN